MRKLSEKQILILKCVENYPQGAFLSQINEGCGISSKQKTYQFLKGLLKRGLIRKFDHLYFLEISKGREIFATSLNTDIVPKLTPEEVNKINLEKLALKKQKQVEYRREYKKANRPYKKLRMQIIEHYSPSLCCQICGFSDVRALQIDHVNGGGRLEREQYKDLEKYYRHIIKMGFPPTYQILCANCNSIKAKSEQRPVNKSDFSNSTKDDIGVAKEESTYLPPPSPNQPNQKLQRMHAIQVYAKIHRGIYSQIESRLAEAGIKATKSMHPTQYTFTWQGCKMRYTTKKLIAWPKQIEASIYVKTEELNSEAIRKGGELIESLTDATKIRLQRTIDKRVPLYLSYHEFAFTDNELARRATQKGGLIAIAYDRLTGKTTLWFDESFTAEMETNTDPLHIKLRKWGQAMQENQIDPLEDELLHRAKEDMLRDEITSIKKLLAKALPREPEPMPQPPEPSDMYSIR